MSLKIGITERGDGGLDQSWRKALEEHRVDGAIVITKAPQLIQDLPDYTVLHCTITGLGGSYIEPGVALPEETLRAYLQLVKRYGPNRVVLRVDPILYWDPWLESARQIVSFKEGRVRISFIDMYPHVKVRFAMKGVSDVKKCNFHGPLLMREQIWKALGCPEVCGEPRMECIGCVSLRDIKAMGLDPLKFSGKISNQRNSCKCLAEKVELLSTRGQCAHKCLYCYWK